MVKLIKDFQNYQYVYYWFKQGIGQISPSLPTLQHVSEWAIQHQSVIYAGEERRSNTRTYAHNPYNRRATDRSPAIDIDLSAKKVTQLLQILEHHAA